MAGTLTLTTGSQVRVGRNRVITYVFAWTSTSGGAVSANAKTLQNGLIVSVKFVPGTSGDQPTDNYDVVLNDADGADVLFGAGANRSNAAASVVRLDPPYVHAGGTLDLVVANAGDTKKGTVSVSVQVS